MPPRPALILLVEDDAVLRRLFSDALKTQGFRVEEASTFDEAVYLFENEPVDLAVLDVMLPDKDGVSLLRFIRKKRQSLPVIMLTALNGANDCLRGFDCGADDYISKP
ncbi:MAG: response regulator, partial [Opitutales bacterium]|nr:response regulator [Opitutales bacterium]